MTGACASCDYLSLGYVCQSALSKNYARYIEGARGSCDKWEPMTLSTRQKWMDLAHDEQTRIREAQDGEGRPNPSRADEAIPIREP